MACACIHMKSCCYFCSLSVFQLVSDQGASGDCACLVFLLTVPLNGGLQVGWRALAGICYVLIMMQQMMQPT
jgi:hypothetical protein